MEKKRVRILLRVSSHRQLEADGDLDVQRQLVLEYVRQRPDWALDGREYFEGGVSGYKNSVARRDILQEIYRDASQHAFDILVAYKDDRIGRRMWEIGGYIMSLKSLGVDIYTVKDGLISPETEDIMGQMVLALRYGNAQKSSSDTGMRVRDTAEKLVEQGKFMGGRAPYGYRLEYSGEISKHGRALKHPVISPEEAEVVRHIYSLYLNRGFGTAKIASTLNREEHYRRLAPGDVWRSGTVNNILSNPIYIGHPAYKRRERVVGVYHKLDCRDWIVSREPVRDLVILDREVWDRVQTERNKRREQYMKHRAAADIPSVGRKDGMLPLVDILRCGCCGGKMVNGSRYNYWTLKSTGERRSSRTAIYRCQNAHQGLPHCGPEQVSAAELDPLILELLAELVESLPGIAPVPAIAKRLQQNEYLQKKQSLLQAQQKLQDIRRKLQILEDHLPEAMAGTLPLSLEELTRQIKKQREQEAHQANLIRQREQELTQAVAHSPQASKKTVESLPSWQEVILQADTPLQRALANCLIHHVDITADTVVIWLRFSPSPGTAHE